MPILVDLNQVVISNLMQQINITKNEQVEEAFLRHMILNSLRSFKNKFGEEYGDMVICNDTTNYWRKKIFPYYKANRKKSRDNSIFDWNVIFQILNKIKDEIRENFPYRYISVASCEADDIIATLTKKSCKEEKVLIVSGDKDFVQLFKYPNVKQYSPVQKKFVEESDPVEFLRQKCIYGDAGDGVPNIASDDDTFATGRRQGRVTQKLIEQMQSNPRIKQNWERNLRLISFEYIPPEIEEAILLAYNEPIQGSHKKLYSYLINNKMKVLLTAYGEF